MDLQTRLKEILKHKYERLIDIVLPINVSSAECFCEYEKHYNRLIDLSDRPEAEEKALFPFDSLLQCDCKHSRSQKTVIALGACGIGKTTAVQRCALDWAEGRAHQHIDLLFILSFWELGLLKKEKLSLIQLLQTFYPDLKELTLSSLSSNNVWFVFDELEDFNGSLLFYCPLVFDVTQVAPVSTILPNLMKGNLLPNCHILITARYAAEKSFPDDHIQKEVEMHGFTNEQIQVHIRNLVGDEGHANRVTDHIKMSRSLFYLCRIPYMCTAMATVLKRHVKAHELKIRPMTLTQIYSSLTSETRAKIIPGLQKYAMFSDQSMDSYCRWITEEELKQNGEFSVDEVSSLVREFPLVFKEEKSVRGVSVFRFAHISIWEYFIALAKLHDITTKNPPRKYRKCLMKVIKLAENNYKDGQYDMCLRFLFGLIKEQRTLPPSDPFFTIVTQKVLSKCSCETKVMLFHSLREIDSQAFLRNMPVHSDEKYVFDDYGECLVWEMITNVEGIRPNFEMKLSARCDETLARSLPALLKSKTAMLRFSNLTDASCPTLRLVLGTRESHLTELDLGFNSITDSGVHELVQGLKLRECKLKSLSLQACELTSSACEHLATALKQAPQLKELDLSCNDIGDDGLQRLASGLQSINCKLQTLKMSQCDLKKKGIFHLAAALEKSSKSLKWLDLSINRIGNKAANELFTKFNISQLTKLEMYYCNLTEKSCEKISAALQDEDGKLVELNLSGNKLGDEGAKWITDGLCAWSRLEQLNLSRCGITAQGCSHLSKALSCISTVLSSSTHWIIGWQATELRELNLSMNHFSDAGAVNISTGFKNPYSHLWKLNLSECSLTCECCSDLATQLSSNECLISELDLSSNSIGDTGLNRLCVGLKSSTCSLETLILRNCDLSSKSVAFLQTALKTNHFLEELFLMGNKLDAAAKKTLVQMTKTDTFTLRSVDVSVD